MMFCSLVLELGTVTGRNQWMKLITDDSRWQSMPINRLKLIINKQSIVQVGVIIDCHQLALVFIDYQYQLINWHQLPSIVDK